MGKSNFYRRSFREEPPAPTEIVSRERLETGECPFPLEYVGPTGEHDEMGLAKRAALALDRDEEIDDIEGATIFQEGKEIIIAGDNIYWRDQLMLIERIRPVSGVASYAQIQSIDSFCEKYPEHINCKNR